MSSQQHTGQIYTICQSRSISRNKKKALIIHGAEPDHFFQCACEKFAGFVRDPQVFVWPPKNLTFQPHRPDDDFAFLSGVDLVYHLDLHPQVHAECLRTQYSLIVFPLYAGCSIPLTQQQTFSKVMDLIRDLIVQKHVAVLFLRGSANSVPHRLGYICNGGEDGFVGYTTQKELELDMNELSELAMRSRVLSEFQNSKLFLDSIKQMHQINNIGTIPNTSFICGIPRAHLKNSSEWHLVIGTALMHPNEARECLLIHREYRCFFTPWYGMPTPDELSHHIVKYFCKFMVEEYFVKTGDGFQAKLKSTYQNQQVTDLIIIC
ncbi:hypothetical protein C9374_006822 [Naegleria lovaniensis]|uniref:Uncharacterized protein n=1 Tax=Naegleria lovaniensis TaxID=51637 RepID=A0AA88KRH1_NAELO|nr:uncharacterized protein C9374_006822 [Naegleria lovaniensis]KAG2393291.1 hypothetical protein C9374_006822 [Naegleria lovaniensis]